MAAAVFTELEKTNFDFQFVLDHLQANPQCANYIGNHNRSCFWVCVQEKGCTKSHLAIIGLLVKICTRYNYDTDINTAAGNGKTPLQSVLLRRHRNPKSDLAYKTLQLLGGI